MLYESLDPQLESAITCICDADWSHAQKLLSLRLEHASGLGRRRLNLFLLSVVASMSGHQAVGEQFAEVARSTPAEMGEPRYFGSTDDHARRELEEAWWVFNGWNPEQGPSSLERDDGPAEVDWAAVLDGALEGRAGELERRWSRFLDGDHPQRPLLWNLLALGYLESGDLRTYEEMRDGIPSEAVPAEVPEVLAVLLSGAGLQTALSDLRNGRWLTSESLSQQSSSNGPPRRAEQLPDNLCSSEQSNLAWEAEIEQSFSLMSVGRPVEAARKLGQLSIQNLPPLHRAYILNALALALFSSGEYGAAEEALDDFRTQAANVQPADEPELSERYREWLLSAGARALAGSPFCDPFAGDAGWTDALDGSGEGAAEAYWLGFEEALGGLRNRDLVGTKRTLRRMVSQPAAGQATLSFLTALLFAGTALLEGDHMEAQDSIDEASRLLEGGGLEAGLLMEAQERLGAADAFTLAGKMTLENLATLDPWRDFPADFQQSTLSGY